ncbi:hypothetical protein KaCgl_00060 [Corynebacterium glutamicum]|uniref:site-specific DNA-methyltransferase n=1 Tax=Corynebacterium glutamicum TaxID=1718 RepID=UPI001462C80E|nr:site-specific DNA-methyltransferase [Corynebacterium glutamicum]BCB32032.1 hypothetical protein KaCgl_00060 [Corynebacterium glutamicum]
MKFLVDLENLLKKDERFISSDGQLLKPLIRDAAGQLDPLLIRALLDSSDLSDHFFKRVDDIVVFDREKFMWVVNSKEFLPDSYTKYRNRIGLSTDDRSLLASSSEITLIWPYKDCVLEGGQEKEDEERDEIFYNETLAPDEVGRLLAPKAFRNARRYVNGDSEPIDQFSQRTI